MKDDSGPRYLRIVREIKARIADQRLMPGQAVPTVTALADEFGVARETAARAVRYLRDAGYVHTSPQGTFVIDRRVGAFSVEVLPYPYATGCRSTIHCANFGFCHRCAPDLAEAASHVIRAMDEIGRVSDGELYDVLMSVLMEARAMNGGGDAPPAGAVPGAEG